MKINWLYWILLLVTLVTIKLLYGCDAECINRVSIIGTGATIAGLLFVFIEQFKIKSNLKILKTTTFQNHLMYGLQIIEIIEWQLKSSQDYLLIEHLFKKVVENISECKKCCAEADSREINDLSEEAAKWNSRIATKVFVASSRFNDVKFNNYLRKLRSFIISKRPIYGNVR
ncbi:MAG: hypothetical protein IPK91_15365 [Saprospiraceae bacterium]|nr:hypothetical protein [Saprospiraceae bacterium]